MSSIITAEAIENFTSDGLDIIGTEGTDDLQGTAQGELIEGLGGDDFISASDGDDLIFGGSGNDTIGAGNGADIIVSGTGDDIVFGFNGNDIIEGNEGDDLLFGNGGVDVLYGGEGNDTLVGRGGADLLEGGAGQDVFEFHASDFAPDTQDVIDDFEVGEDSIVIKGLGEDSSVSFDADGNILVNGQTVIKFGPFENSDSMTIEEESNGDFEIM